MPTHPYFAADGQPIPGTTTIIGRWKNANPSNVLGAPHRLPAGTQQAAAALYTGRRHITIVADEDIPNQVRLFDTVVRTFGSELAVVNVLLTLDTKLPRGQT
jgi:hypothetical protein